MDPKPCTEERNPAVLPKVTEASPLAVEHPFAEQVGMVRIFGC
jgi:hypothetical protein